MEVRREGGKVIAKIAGVDLDLDKDGIPSLEVELIARADEAEATDEVMKQVVDKVKAGLPDWAKKILGQ